MAEVDNWRPFSDGWFDFFLCPKCGYKTMNKPKICPACNAQNIIQTSKKER